MKTGIAWSLFALLMPVCVFATTLRLSTDIDLLVLDGKKVSSSLLRGADSIELDNGPHQIVFRVEKTIRLGNHEERVYISPPWSPVSTPSASVRLILVFPGWKQKKSRNFLIIHRILNYWMAMRPRFR